MMVIIMIIFFVKIFITLCISLDITYAKDCLYKTEMVIGGREIRLFNEKKTYEEANQACELWGLKGTKNSPGKLMSIMRRQNAIERGGNGTLLHALNNIVLSTNDWSWEEKETLHDQTCVKEMISNPRNYKPWEWISGSKFEPGYFVGATDKKGEGNWMWENGKKLQYQNWAAYEPNNYGAGEDCLQLLMTDVGFSNYKVGKWIDMSCHSSKFFICERDVEPWNYVTTGETATNKILPSMYPSCSGKWQSPVDLPSRGPIPDCEQSVRQVRGWKVEAYAEWEVENTGQFIRITPLPKRSMWSTFYGGTKKYYVSEMILKWGESSHMGSDHMIGGKRAEGELQVYYEPHSTNERHALAFLLEETNELPNHHWYELLHSIAMVQFPQTPPVKMAAPKIGVTELLKHDSYTYYYSRNVMRRALRYHGSLPHPPCTENIVWTVFPRRLKLSVSQFEELRQTRSANGAKLFNKPRPIQSNDSPVCLI